MDTAHEGTEAAAIAALAQSANRRPEIIPGNDGREHLLIPDGEGRYRLQDVSDPNRDPGQPPLIRQGVTLQSLDSLVDYVNVYKSPDTILFADIDKSAIHAALDYHAPEQATHGAHSARMALPYSVEWQAWTAIDGKLMEQLEFARFLEENAGDVKAPTGAELLEVCRDLQAVRKVNFIKAVRTDSDNENFEYTDETQATGRKGNLEIPTKFKLEIPVYFGEAATELYAFLRWRLDDGNMKIGIRLHRAEHVRQAVFKQIVLRAADGCERKAVFGRLDPRAPAFAPAA